MADRCPLSHATRPTVLGSLQRSEPFTITQGVPFAHNKRGGPWGVLAGPRIANRLLKFLPKFYGILRM